MIAKDFKPYRLTKLKQVIAKDYHRRPEGILFCFGTSFISKLIQCRTRKNRSEIVPSHTAMIYTTTDGVPFLYESTSSTETTNDKIIYGGVRRMLLSDFYNIEVSKTTEYYFMPLELNINMMENKIHLPYGIDLIVDFAIKNESDGDSNGLICSQYVNLCTNLLPDEQCPSPADMWRKAKKIMSNNIK